MRTGAYYMHEKHMDICARVLECDRASGACLVEWYNLGYTGSPWPLGVTDTVYINGNWRDISKLIYLPRKEWPDAK